MKLRIWKKKPKPKRTPSIHDYTRRYWGHDFTILKLEENGHPMHLMGWGLGLVEGDYLILPNGPRETTRYRLTMVKYFPDPRDMWAAYAVFDPRKEEQ